jgi:hypothetical protein
LHGLGFNEICPYAPEPSRVFVLVAVAVVVVRQLELKRSVELGKEVPLDLLIRPSLTAQKTH